MNGHAVHNQTLWRDDKYPCCLPSLCRGVAMNGDVARNPTWRCGHTPYYGVLINGHVLHYPRVVA